jgi:pimeloyl-ACP methyl ester carboxylesterase
MPFLKREHRTRIYYEVHGEGEPLILTHGYSSTSAMWQGQKDAFVKSGFQLITWDMRGHGRSTYPDDQAVYSEAHTIDDMAAILDKVCGEGRSAIVGGLSLGGYMSLAFYRKFPERVETLLIIGGYFCQTGRNITESHTIRHRARFQERRRSRGVEQRCSQHGHQV